MLYLVALEQLESTMKDYSAWMDTERFTDQVMAVLPELEAEPSQVMFKNAAGLKNLCFTMLSPQA